MTTYRSFLQINNPEAAMGSCRSRNQDKLQYPDWIEDAVVVLVSKDDRRFELKFGIALCSDTIKALAGFPEGVEEREEVSPAAVHCLMERTRAIFVIVVVAVDTRRRANSSPTS